VIAHRLSTVRAADCIYVLSAGEVVQTGRFDDLASAEGPFRELVRRQLLEAECPSVV
jgi:ABC-type multidrug transport system fused ATPase/permease subunit